MKYATTIKFLLNIMSKKDKPLQINSVELSDQNGFSFPADIYEPVNEDHYKGTIIFFHGMNKLGNKDERMVALFKAAARANFRAVAPDYEILKNHFVDGQSVHDFAATIRMVANDKALTPSGKVGLFTASFSGTFTVHAAIRDDVNHLIASLCSVGVCYHPIETFTGLLDGRGADSYSRFISMKNLLFIAGELDSVSEKALSLGIDDNFVGRKHQFEDYLKTIEDKEKREYLEEIGRKIYAQEDLATPYAKHIQMMQDAYFIDEGLKNLKCNVALIHSEDDKVLHTTESKLLCEQLKRHHVPVKMVITPLLEHADVQFKIKYLIDVFRLINGFAFFFDHIKR